MAEPLVVCFRYRKLESEGWCGTRLSVVYWVGTPLDTSVEKHLVEDDVTGAKVVKGGHSVTDYDELSFRTKNSVANGLNHCFNQMILLQRLCTGLHDWLRNFLMSWGTFLLQHTKCFPAIRKNKP